MPQNRYEFYPVGNGEQAKNFKHVSDKIGVGLKMIKIRMDREGKDRN